MYFKMNKANEQEEINRSCLSKGHKFVSVFYATYFNHILFNSSTETFYFEIFLFFLFYHLSSSGCICWLER